MINLIALFLWGTLIAFSWTQGVWFSLSVAEHTVHIKVWVAIAILALCYYVYSMIKTISQKVKSLFVGRPAHEKGLESFQQAFSDMLLKNHSSAEKHLNKAKKYLGNVPILSWLEGQLYLINKNEYQAKAIFYSLGEKEKDTSFGAHSLCQLAIKNGSSNEALQIINNILHRSRYNPELIEQGVAFALKNENFVEARKLISSLKDGERGRRLKAITCYEEGMYVGNPDLFKESYKLYPELTVNTLQYVDHLIRSSEYRQARKILRRAFSINPDEKVFNIYVSCGDDISCLDKIKYANELISDVPESWIGHYGLAKLEIACDRNVSALQNLQKAFSCEPFDFIASLMVEIAEKLSDADSVIAHDILSKPLRSKNVKFIWKCSSCDAEESDWVSVCKYCNCVGGYRFTQKQIRLNLQ